MNRELGEFLERLRRTARISRTEGARRSGVSRMTLFRWERGSHIPREYELHAVLDAYETSPVERREVWALREREAISHLTRSGRRPLTVQTHLGDLLLALRQRAGLTQAEVAARAEIPRFALRNWENLRSWPDDATLHRLAYALGATEMELLALTAPPSQREMDNDGSLDALYHAANWMTWGWPSLDRSEPELLRLIARMREEAPHSREARRLLMTLEYGYASLLTSALRPREAARWLKRADADFLSDPTPAEMAVPTFVRTIVEQEALKRAGPLRRRRTLQQRWKRQQAIYAVIDATPPTWKIAHRVEMAATLHRMGDDDSALRLAQFALSLAERIEWSQSEMRLHRYGEMLHEMGRHDQIADLFPRYLGRSPFADVHIRYYLGLAARAHGDEVAADALLRQSLADAAIQGRPSLERDIRESLDPQS